MLLTNTQTFLMILAVAAGTMLTRFTPFLLFPEKRQVPKYVVYLGRVLPPAMMGLLVVYCFKNIDLFSGSHGIPEAVATLSTIILHKWKSNVLLSITGGTIAYMLLVQIVFK